MCDVGMSLCAAELHSALVGPTFKEHLLLLHVAKVV